MVDKNWTFEQAFAETEKEQSWDSPTSPVNLWTAFQAIEGLRANVERGDGTALLRVIYHCALRDLVLPDWAARKFLTKFRKVIHHEAKSWDTVFGKPHRKGMQLHGARLRREKAPQVWLRVTNIRRDEPKTPIGDELFARVAKELGINKTLCNELYYERQRDFERDFERINGCSLPKEHKL